MNIDTETIRRLRDALIANGRLEAVRAESDADGMMDRMQASINRVAPFVETLYLVMIADGHIESREKEAITGAISMLTHGFLAENALVGILQASEAEVSRCGVEGRLQMLGAILSADRQDREIAYTLAAAVALADNTLAQQEGSILDSIAEWYGVSQRRREEILRQL